MLILNVATQPIKTEYTTQKASLDSQTTLPKIQIDTQAAKLEIRQPEGKLEIDQTPCRYALGIKNMQDFSRDNAQEGRNSAIEAIGRIVDEGNRLGSIESGENAVVEIAADTNSPPPGELTLAYIPLPDIHFTRNPPQIHATEGKLDINLQRGNVEGDFTPGKVGVNVTQYPSIKMWTSPNKVDLML